MLQLRNRTRFAATLLPLPNPAGHDSLYAIVKGTFSLGPKPTLAEEQLPVQYQDAYAGEPGKSSVTVPSDAVPVKPGTDVLVRGHAYPEGGRKGSRTSVSLSCGTIDKQIEVWGDRIWEGGLLSSRPSVPEPFEKIPLLWERSFGGVDPVEGQPSILEGDARNPVGIGFRGRRSASKIAGSLLPNIEDPRQLITSPRDRPSPVGFGPIAPHWEPRKSYAGTYDQNWQKQRAPFLPSDFDPRFFQVAPADQVMPGYLRGGEAVRLSGVTPSGSLSLTVPAIPITIVYNVDGAKHPQPANLDTLLIEPDEKRLVLVWRSVFTLDKKLLRIREVEIAGGAGVL